jgi:type II secretory pathway component PulC
MKKWKLISRSLLVSVVLSCAWLAQSWAEPSQLKAIKDLEKEASKKYETITRPKVEYKASGSRDPFTGIAIEENIKDIVSDVSSPPPDLKVQGIIWGGRLPQAIINNKVLKVGDTVQNAKVINIGKDGVTVLFGGRNFTLGSPAAGSAATNKEE